MDTNVMRRTFFSRAPAWGLLSAFLLLVLWACHLGPDDDKDSFNVVGEESWTDCDEVTVVLLDGNSKPVDTLFQGPLESLDQLKKLDASGYKGGKGGVSIRGIKDGGLCFEQKRTFDAPGGTVLVDTVSDPNVAPKSLEVDPDSLVIAMGSPAANLSASPVPAYADADMIWSLDNSGVVALEGLLSGRGNPVKVKALKPGAGMLTVRSAKDTSVSRTVRVRVVSTTLGGIEIVTRNDTVRLYERGPSESLEVEVPAEYAGQRIQWQTGSRSVAEVDAEGRIKPVKAGQTHVQATLIPSGLSDVAVVTVKLDVPVLVVDSKRGAPVGVDIVFSARATQEFGSIVMFKWNLDGDGAWDDSSAIADTARAVTLPAKKARYAKEGPVVAAFLVRDTEGNEAEAEVLLDIGNQAPEVSGLRKDTTISVKDEIPMPATVRDVDGKVAWVGWDYEGDGQFDDTLAASDSVVAFTRRHRFVEAGAYNAVFKAVDASGKARLDTSRVKVEFDAPVADAGPDFTVGAGETLTLSAKGTDRFGTIARRAVKCGSDTAFKALSAQDTSFRAPSQPGALKCVVRVTDDDGLSDEDEVQITVVLSSNADLVELTLSAGGLVPEFRTNTAKYEGRVAFSDSAVTVTPKAKDASAEILVNGKKVASGAASPAVRLPVGRTLSAFTVLVTAADGSQREYVINMTRDPNGEATLARLEAAGLTLSPSFAPGTVDYVDTVAYDLSSVTFKATVASAGATLAFGDSAMTSGTFTPPQALGFGENAFRFVVTAMDGNSTTTYTVRVRRLGRLITFRKLGGAAATAQDTFAIAVGAAHPLSIAGTPAYAFTGWTLLEGDAAIADTSANPTTLTLKSGLVRAQAAFQVRRYTLTVSSAGCGSVSPGTSTVDHGTTHVLSIKPDAGCRIQGVKVDGTEDPSAYDGEHTFATVSRDHSLSVTFVRTFTLTMKVGLNGKSEPEKATVDSGSSFTFRFTPAAGYGTFRACELNARECGKPKGDSLRIPAVRANLDFGVTFARQFNVTGTVNEGAGSISPADSTVDSSDVVTWRLRPASGYRVAGVKAFSNHVWPVDGDSSLVRTPAGGAIGNHAVTAFYRRFYTLTVTSGPGGTVNQASRSVDTGTTLSFTATPLSGYRVDTVLVNGLPAETNGLGGAGGMALGPRTWSVGPIGGNVAVRVTFRRYYTLEVKNGTGGALTPALVNVDSGASQTFTITPEAGYRLVSLSLDGTDVMSGVSGLAYTIPSVTAGGTLVPAFSNQYTVRLTSNTGGVRGSTYAEVCITADGIQSCNPTGRLSLPSVARTLTYGTSVVIEAAATFTDCGGIICQESNFHYWDGLKAPLEANPHKFTVTSDITLQAIYGEGVIR